MNNIIKTDFHTFNTSPAFKTPKYFYNCEPGANGFASIFAHSCLKEQEQVGLGLPKPCFYRSLHFHLLFFFFWLSSFLLQATQYVEPGLAPDSAIELTQQRPRSP